jgi:hypothetical protein
MRDTCDGKVTAMRDPNADAIRRFGLADVDEQVPHLIARPAAFVIDAAGIVRYRYVSRTPDDRPTTALLLLAAESLVDDSA